MDDKALKMTFDEYDILMEKMEKLKLYTFWPTLSDIDLFLEDPLKWIVVACYLYEFGAPPKNKDEQYRKKTLYQFIQKYLFLT